MLRGRLRNKALRSTRSHGMPPHPPERATSLLAEARGSLVAAGCVLVAVIALCTALLVCLSPTTAQAVPTDLQSIPLTGDAQNHVDALTQQAAAVQAEIDALDDQLEGYTESFNQLQLQLTEVNQQMTTLRRQLKAAQNDHAYRVRKYEDRICTLYKSGRDDEFLSLLLASEGLGDLIQRVRLIATLADHDKRVVENLEESTSELSALLAKIDEKKAEELVIRDQIEGQKEQIQTALAQRETALTDIDGEITAILKAEQDRQRNQVDHLRNAVAAILSGTQVYAGPLPQTESEILNQFLDTAAYYIGIPYVWAGDRPSTGFDCSGYVAYVYAQHGVSLPHYSGFQAQMGQLVMPEDIQPGDLLAFGLPVHHVGIYIGDGLFIHAPRTGDVVSVWELSWKTNLSAIRRFDLQPRVGEPAVW